MENYDHLVKFHEQPLLTQKQRSNSKETAENTNQVSLNSPNTNKDSPTFKRK